ncbi:hypothetical protein CLV27_1361 [Phorcysia thermohydrogeniphila]|uniref:Uncharacterized protein n=1 Tax=Phorcysia thermohydrogeniphila TaxID=936138 RepID=A0A4R1GBB5_9BACT|nr:hypothetical protein CLV27_1361 [Phorcysia thermohydrogeniphila]
MKEIFPYAIVVFTFLVIALLGFYIANIKPAKR